MLHHWRRVWQALEATYTQRKRERHVLDFDDLEQLTVRLLEAQPRSSRLQAFLDDIHHLMVDEFQDTNEVQQRILYALAPPEAGGRLFVVGDAKQSIYRFRQAQVAIFHRTGQDIERASGQPPVALDRSFRTQGTLLAALNHAFEHLLRPLGTDHEPFEARPAPLVAARPAGQPHPACPAPVELLLLPKEEASEALTAGQARRWEAAWLAQRLLALHEQRFPVWERQSGSYRPFNFGDAAVLLRATTDMALYEEQFQAAGLPYLANSGRGYYQRPEVQELITLLACLHNPRDDLSLATVLRSPLFCLSDETLYRLRWHAPSGEELPFREPRPLRDALRAPPPTDQPDALGAALALFETLWALSGRVPVWQLLHLALEQTGYAAALALDAAARGPASRQLHNAQKFVALAREQGGSSLSDFLRHVQARAASAAREGEAHGQLPEGGAVQLMSVHAAKGLEFAVVAVADLGRTPHGGFETPRVLHDPAFGMVSKLRDARGEWQKPASYRWGEWMTRRLDAAESKRLLYVACTRAADLLLLSGQLAAPESWLHELLDAWQIAPTAEPDRLEQRGTFAVRVHRPALSSLPAAPPLPAPPHESQGAPDAFPLVAPLLRRGAPPVLPLLRSLPGADATAAAEPLLRRALADWACLALPPDELAAALARMALQEGLLNAERRQRAVAAAQAALAQLQRSSLYEAIAAAAQRHVRLPLTLAGRAGLEPSMLDLLFQDAQGGWHLVAWHTGWASGAAREEAAAARRPALEAAAHRLQARLGVVAGRLPLLPRPGMARPPVCLAAPAALLESERATGAGSGSTPTLQSPFTALPRHRRSV